METCDEDLIVAHRQGDAEAFGELMNRYSRSLYNYLLRMTADRGQAEDLFQGVFMHVHRKAGRFRAGGSFKSWLFAIATNLAIDEARKQRHRPLTVPLDCARQGNPSGPPAARTPERDPAEQAVVSDRRAMVREAIGRLPKRQRAALVMSYYHELSHREIADAMGCSVGTVKTHLSRALQTLARLLPAEEGVAA